MVYTLKYLFSKKAIALLLAFTLFCCHAYAQNYEKIVIDKTDNLYGYYLAVRPQSNNIQGVMVLLPGYGSGPESIFPETKLQNVAFANDILTIAVSTDKKLYVDKSVSDGLNKILKDVLTRFSVPADKFIIGGYSAGGTLALRYTELCKQQPASFPIQPAGVFSVDGPVDLVDLYGYFEREIKKNFAQAGVSEAVMAKGIMDNEIGTLKDNKPAYISLSPFCMSVDGPGNEQYLTTTPVRVYHDVDILWMLQNRRRSVRDMNVFASSELINRLLLAGNDKAEFMPGKKGYRSNGARHPHSWSIVDEVELVQWVKKTLQFFPQYAPEPYNFPTKNWNTEKDKFPLYFAPSIPYKGLADIRFLPGWGSEKDSEFFSYCYLWYLDGNVAFTESSVQHDVEAYYSGLNQGGQDSIAKVTVKKVQAAAGYEQTFECVIHTFDKFTTHKPITLNGSVNIKQCSGNGQTIAFFEISPSPFGSSVWQKLHTVRDGVECNK